jgi:hypothetical protein
MARKRDIFGCSLESQSCAHATRDPVRHTEEATPMEDHHETKDIPGYNTGSSEIAKSPIDLDELKDLKASTLFTDEDVVYLRLSYDVQRSNGRSGGCGAALLLFTRIWLHSHDERTGQDLIQERRCCAAVACKGLAAC